MTLLSSRTNQSFHLYEQAKKVIPGGVSANIKFFEPHPIVMEKANGSRLIDVDGNEYVDYSLCYGALILGHGHKKVLEAVFHHLTTTGTSVFGAPHPLEIKMAQKIVELFPGMDMVRFTNSGLEATLLAIRLAEAKTGKNMIGKFEGHYHGGYDQVLFNVNPPFKAKSESNIPTIHYDSMGIPKYYEENILILPFNDLETTEQLVRKHKDKLAAIILEPIEGGYIPAEKTFMEGLRKLTEELGIILIFDEVKTGFRLTVGGAQSVYQITPDITALGKVLGGGFPIGAVAGKKEMMELMDPHREKSLFQIDEQNKQGKGNVLFHSGTYNGHPTVLSAGLSTISYLEEPFVMEELLLATKKLRNGLEEVYKKYNIPMQTIGKGSIFNIVLTDRPVKNYHDMRASNIQLRKAIDHELLKLGVYIKPLNRYSLSVAHTEKDLSDTIDAHEKAIKKVKG